MTATEIQNQLASFKREGRLPLLLTKRTEEEISKSLARYFSEASEAKVLEFTEKAKDLATKALANIEVGGVEKAQEAEQPDRILLRDFIAEHGEGEIGETMRMELFQRVPQEVAQGAGEFIRQNESEEELEEYPALELVRGYARRIPRGTTGKEGDDPWEERWAAAGGELVDGERMVALKSDPVWQNLGAGSGGYDDALGNPFPPFWFNSGGIVESVSRKEAIELGLMEEGDEVKAAPFDFSKLFPSLEARMGRDRIQIIADAYHCGNYAAARVALQNPPLYAGEFNEEDHPRADDGKWTSGGGGTSLTRTGTGKDAKWMTEKGEDAPEFAQKLGIPPAWTGVRVAPSEKEDVLAIGKDAKGREQRIYSDEATARQAAIKFARNRELITKQHAIFKQNDSNLEHADKGVRENAAAMKLIQQTGIRPGSDADTGAKVKAYGATTLEGRHVVEDKDGNVRLEFVGKKGVSLKIPVEDKATAKMLVERSKSAGKDGKLFDTNDASLRDYSHTLNGGSFKPKDFRTLKGTQTAINAIDENPAPAKTMKEYKERVKDIAKRVAAKLGNTPAIALQSYINPFVFARIKPA